MRQSGQSVPFKSSSTQVAERPPAVEVVAEAAQMEEHQQQVAERPPAVVVVAEAPQLEEQQQQVAVEAAVVAEYRLDYLSTSVSNQQLQLLALVVGLDDGHDDGLDADLDGDLDGDLDDGHTLLDAGHAQLFTSVVRLHALRDQCLFQHLHHGWPLRHRERHQNASDAEDLDWVV